ncbi:MAG TPA: TlpA disulfide reductase family protein [Chitinophagaceae bacterium]|nr:TlpA disulfide reductase family protein [Chitinophagaceae bacterium]
MNPQTIFLSCFFSLLQCLTSQARTQQQDIPLKNLNGQSVSLKSVIDSNRITAISFWATWCGPCINELDAIQDKIESDQQKLFHLIAISTDEARTANKVKPFIKTRGWSFDVYLDESNEVKQAFNVTNIPFIIIINKGKVVYQKSGYMPGDEDLLFEKINQLKSSGSQ